MAIFPVHISTPRLREDRWLGVPPNPAYFTALGEDAPVSPHAKRAKRGWGPARAVRPPKTAAAEGGARREKPCGASVHLSFPWHPITAARPAFPEEPRPLELALPRAHMLAHAKVMTQSVDPTEKGPPAPLLLCPTGPAATILAYPCHLLSATLQLTP